MAITVRFSEHNRYDIMRDADVVLLMATTSKGSYFAEVPSEGPISLRKRRQMFKEKAIEAIEQGINPGELDLDGH